NMKMQHLFWRIMLFIGAFAHGIPSSQAQSGDQILDGIGETDMIARYLFDGDLRDWSRNNLHAKFNGGEAEFASDERFGKVLSLSGNSSAFITLPSAVLTDLESLSISGWVYLRSDQSGQHLFDFGQDASKHFSVAPVGRNGQDDFQAIITSGRSDKKGAVSPALASNKWTHIAVVVDIPSKSLRTYVDGKPAGET